MDTATKSETEKQEAITDKHTKMICETYERQFKQSKL